MEDLPIATVTVDDSACGGHGNCVLIAAEVFSFVGDDDVVSVLNAEVPAHLSEAVERARGACPNRAISTS